MKKYWQSIAVLVMIVAGLGTFFVNAQGSGNYPEFNLATVSGDDQAAEAIQLDMYYEETGMQYEGGYLVNALTVTPEGTKNRMDDYSYFERLDGVIGDPKYADLIRDYRQFMRGKNPWSGAVNEDDAYLAHADVDYELFEAKDYTLELSVLDKQTGDDNTFSHEIENDSKIDHMDVQAVRKNGNQLKVFVDVFTQSLEKHRAPSDQQIKAFTFDLDSHKLTDEQTLGKIGRDTNGYDTSFELLNSSNKETSSDYVVFRKQVTIYDETGAGTPDSQISDKGLLVYNIKTDQVDELELPERLGEQERVRYFDGKHLYFTETNEAGLNVLTYSIADADIIDETQVEMDQQPDTNNIHLRKKSDRFYIGLQEKDIDNPTQLVIVDANTGDMQYEGEVKAASPSDVPGNASLELQDMRVAEPE